ncbi:MAG: transposase, partial [Verrucomicrobia bacterium]|nr:transposase [Verrucomicrobiota bacterium]
HPTMRLTLEELRRNQDLRKLGEMEHAGEVPEAWNISRFLSVLGREPFRDLLQGVFAQMVAKLAGAVEDLGKQTAGDATHLSARRRGRYEPGLCEPDGGRKEYVDQQGQVTEAFEWFGYKLHVLCDSRHEVALAYRITPASRADNEQVEALLHQAEAALPEKRMQTMAYDKAYDDGKVHALLKQHHVRPVIQQRAMWKEEPERVLQGAGIGNVVYDEAGTVYCYDLVSNPVVRHAMAYIGHEPSRGTLKYRCPAEHESWRCACSKRCNKGKRYGMTVRVKQEIDLRRFPPIPRATKKFERLYKGRTACERVNARLKVFWGVDDGNVGGGASFHANVGVIMVVHIGLAALMAGVPRRDPQRKLGQTRLSPIAKALHGS